MVIMASMVVIVVLVVMVVIIALVVVFIVIMVAVGVRHESQFLQAAVSLKGECFPMFWQCFK